MAVPQVGGQPRQVRLDVGAVPVPAQQDEAGRLMAHVMKAGPAQRQPRADPGVADDAGEPGLHGVVDQALAVPGRGYSWSRRCA